MDTTNVSHISSYLSSVTIAAGLLLAFGYLLVQQACPRPLPGIPYNQAATKRVFGDIPEIDEYARKGGSFRTWFLGQAHKHNSAITQVLLGPFSKAAIIVSDYREVNDILSHRDAVDFKRGLKVDGFRGILPHAFPAMETFDPDFRSSRNLARDLMTPSFLHAVNAPRIYDVACHLLELWRMKSRLAMGRPFDVMDDISEFSFDAILSAAMGLGPQGGDIEHKRRELAKNTSSTPSVVNADVDSPVLFPQAPRSAKLNGLRVEEASLSKSFTVPWPGLYHRVNNLRPSVRAARRTLHEYIASQIDQTVPGLADGSKDPQCALDFVIQRELQSATKEGRLPALADPRILEPIYGYLIAGHDTSSGSVGWLIHRLVTHPVEQDRVREGLRATYPDAWRERRLPTVAELVKVHSPHLDAFIEETLRCDTPVVNIMVMTRHDTVVLGHQVPADTRVFLNLAGPSLNRQSVPVAEADRCDTSKMHKPAVARENWDAAAPEEFHPERWLKDCPGPVPVFDPAAGPALAFSAGNRGCWGKRLGYLELRIALALLVWSLEFNVSENLANWETIDLLVTAPKHCIIQVTEILHY
ncbi:cytochrome P450 [Xylariaceae sp. AK1471]|nr:cytochrome P450 [Xylariaceae sp. AK1471]